MLNLLDRVMLVARNYLLDYHRNYSDLFVSIDVF